MRLSLKDNISLYDSIKDHDYFFTKEHNLRGEISIELISEVIDKKSKSPLKLLSIACSTGVIEEKIKNRLGIVAFGVDAAKKSLRTARKRGIITKYTDVSEPMPFKSNYFDFVFAGEIIEHIFDTKSFLNEIYRVLKPNGYLILSTPNLARFDDRLKFLFGKTPRQVAPFHPYLYLHIRPFTFDLLKNTLNACNFTNITLRTNVIDLNFFGKEIKIYSKLFTRLFPTFGSTLIIRAQKLKNEPKNRTSV
ncbi:Ubiquinone biosynthesis O-methyltransferase, mitochondrial [subsurface metagenome]